MKQIFLSIQERLAEQVPALRYIDKNWGQLNLPQPPVQWPCCLIDLDSIDYSQIARDGRRAVATISLTVADCHTARSSAKAPAKASAYDILDTVQAVVAALHGWRIPLASGDTIPVTIPFALQSSNPDTTQPLVFGHLAKAYSDQSYDVYTLTFTTAWTELETKEGDTALASPSLSVKFSI